MFENKYKIIKDFNANTFLAKDTNNKRVVLKILILSKITDWKIIELFEREAEILKHLNHVGIPKYVDAGHIKEGDENIFYLVQEYIEGLTLKDFIEKGIPLSEDDIFNITQELLEILDYLSNLVPPIIHRDIKPSNIIIKDDKSVALIDFGAIKNISSKNNVDVTVVGTTGFIAPEQLMGKEATIQSDLYSLGVTLVNLLTRINPTELPIIDMKIQFRRETGFNTFYKNFLDELIDPRSKFRIKTPKKALSYLQKIRKGKFGRDIFAIPKNQEIDKDIMKVKEPKGVIKYVILSIVVLIFISMITSGYIFFTLNKTSNPKPIIIDTNYVDNILDNSIKKVNNYPNTIYGCINDYLNKTSYINNAKNITTLSCTNRNITSLAGIEKYPQITGLYIYDNKISDLTPLISLPNLKELSIAKNNVSDISIFKNLKNLEQLSIYDNPIHDISVLKELKYLEKFVSFNNSITDFTSLSNLTRMKELQLSFYGIRDITFLEKLTKLERLTLNNNNISDISVLKNLKNLKYLSLSKNKISDISALKDLTNLTFLVLSQNEISDISALKNMIKMNFLSLAMNKITDFTPIKDLSCKKIIGYQHTNKGEYE